MAVKIEIKKKLLEECLRLQNKHVTDSRAAMEQSQQSANEEKGKMGDKFESFREQMQIERDMHARQYQEALDKLAVLKKINPETKADRVVLGAVIYSDFQNLFISVSLGQVHIENEIFVAVSTATPIYKVLAGKQKGESFEFRDKKYKVVDVF